MSRCCQSRNCGIATKYGRFAAPLTRTWASLAVNLEHSFIVDAIRAGASPFADLADPAVVCFSTILVSTCPKLRATTINGTPAKLLNCYMSDTALRRFSG
jgi:hypothetical protein